MKIISKFKDYYDFAVGYDTDPRKIFIRDTVILGKNVMIAQDKYKLLYTCARDLERVVYEINQYTTRRSHYYVGRVVFCNFIYPYLYDIKTKTYYYRFEEIPSKIVEVFDSNSRYYPRNEMYRYFLMEERWSQKGYIYKKITNACNYNKLAGAPVLYSWLNKTGEEEYVMNGCLEDVKFGAIKSPQEAFQELYNWIEFKEPESDSAPENMDRFASKGFDKKTSFRNIK